MKVQLSILATTVCALAVAFPLSAANGPTAKTNKNMTTSATMRSAWPPETISGKITMVNPDRKLVIVEPPSGVPFDMVVTSKTRIKSGNQSVALKDLTQDVNKTVSVKFTPERRGDVANSIQIGG